MKASGLFRFFRSIMIALGEDLRKDARKIFEGMCANEARYFWVNGSVTFSRFFNWGMVRDILNNFTPDIDK